MISKEFSGAPIHQFARCGVSAGSFKGQNHPGASEKLVGSWSFCCFGMGLTVCILDLQRHWCSSELWCYIGVEAVTGSLWLTGQITQGQFDLVVSFNWRSAEPSNRFCQFHKDVIFVHLMQVYMEHLWNTTNRSSNIATEQNMHRHTHWTSKIKRISWRYVLASWTELPSELRKGYDQSLTPRILLRTHGTHVRHTGYVYIYILM